MLRKDMTKSEIEKELNGKGDYVLIDNITRFLKENPALDVKKFLYLKLTEIYERRNMFSEAAELYDRLSEISSIVEERAKYFTKETEDYIKAGFFDKADLALKKIIVNIKASERPKIMLTIKEFYKNQANTYEKEKRRSLAVKTYEKLLDMNIPDLEKEEINRKLLELYQSLGMIKKLMILKEKLR